MFNALLYAFDLLQALSLKRITVSRKNFVEDCYRNLNSFHDNY